MDLSQALRLLGFSIGGVLQFSLIVLIRRYRPIRRLQILLLWLAGCLLAWNTCNLLRLTIGSTEGVTQMTRELMQLGPGFIAYCALWFVPSFLLHTHLALGRAFFPGEGAGCSGLLKWPSISLFWLCQSPFRHSTPLHTFPIPPFLRPGWLLRCWPQQS